MDFHEVFFPVRWNIKVEEVVGVGLYLFPLGHLPLLSVEVEKGLQPYS